MKTTIAMMALAVSSTLAVASNPEGEKLKVNTTESELIWKGKKITGEHFGKISLQEGWIEVDGKNIKNGAFVTNMETITVEDLQGEYAEKLKAHLSSPDFFNVAENKTSKLTITNVQQESGDEYTVSGNLEIKGIEKPVTFPAKVKVGKGKVVMRGKLVFDRTEYEIKYGSGKFFKSLGDKAIKDEVELDFIVIAEK